MSVPGASDDAAHVVEEFLGRQRSMYGGGPIEPVEAMLAENIVWHVPGRSPIAGDYRGPSAVIGYFARRRAVAGGRIRIIKHAELARGDVLVQLADGEAEMGGRPESWRTAGVYRVADGKIAEAWLVPLESEAFDEAWASTRPGAFSYRQRVRPRDCASSRVLRHLRLLEFLEAAFLELWRSRVGSFQSSLGDERQLTLRAIELDYPTAVRVDDVVEVQLDIDRITEDSLQLYCDVSVANTPVASARAKYACVYAATCASAAWPEIVHEQLAGAAR